VRLIQSDGAFLPQRVGVVFHSVFHYFPTVEYAARVCVEAYDKLKSGGWLCVMDVNDLEHKPMYDAERKKLYGDSDAYDRKYAGLQHQFYDKPAFRDLLLDLGYREVTFFSHAVAAYANSAFRFNIQARK
jgi:hypothetical protein